MNILQSFKPIQLIVMDVDGVLTNGNILLLQDGQMARNMNIKDGFALQLAIKKGYQLMVISGASDDAVARRLEKLGLTEIYLGVTDKATLLAEKIAEKKLTKQQVIFIGDDIPDYSAMQLVALPCCPSDASYDIKEIAQYISPYKGGEGCVRDILEKVLKLNDHWELQTSIVAK